MTTQLPKFTFRPAQDGDRTQFVNLARLAFSPMRSLAQVEQEMQDQPLNSVGRKGWVVVDDETGQLVARYRHLELALFLAGVRFPMAGVAGVAVALERRGRKIAQWMLEQALKDFREQQIPISMLYPFQHGFYRKLGWAWTGRSHQYRVSARHIPLYSQRLNILPYRPNDEESLKAVYQKAVLQHNGWLQREPWYWEWQEFFKPEGGCEIYCYTEASEMNGYVVIEFTHLGPTKTHLAVVVQEWVALTPHAYRGILGFLASLRDQVTTVVWNTYPDDPFPHLLNEQRRDPALPNSSSEFGLTHRFGEIGGGFMWRLVDVANALERRPIQMGEPFAIAFQIADPVFGKQVLTAEFADGRIQYRQKPATTVIKTSVEHLTELFCGMRRAIDLLWTGEIEVEGDRALLHHLDHAWETNSPFCWDFF